MSRHGRPSKIFILALGSALTLGSAAPQAFADVKQSGYSKRDSALYRDAFDQNIYYEGTQYLHLERLSRGLTGVRKRAQDVNLYDEIPDSNFFTNRHGREQMSLDALKQGAAEGDKPGRGEHWTITKGKFQGITPGFFVRNEKGEKFLLKFDPMDSFEMATGAEAVTSRFLYALGYNVPEYSLVYFKKDQLGIQEGARIYDESGFRRKLTPDRLEEFLLFVPESEDGASYRASASRFLSGEILGPMKLQGRRKEDTDDPVNHEDRREIRALQVFNAWLNNNDVREGNTLDVVQDRDGKSQIVHYLIDFNSGLGATPRGPKPPMFGHEHMVDYGEATKAFLSFGFWKKPWQKRWDGAGRETVSPAVGYFDNRELNPGRYKSQLPHFPFKDLGRADGFWAAKILMKFTDEEIGAIVSTGEFSKKEDEEYLTKTLIERRDVIARYWFAASCPLDEFELEEAGGGSYDIHFEDLRVRHGFVPKDGRTYLADVIVRKGNRELHLLRNEIHEPRLRIEAEWLREQPSFKVVLRTRSSDGRDWGPFVRVGIQSEAGTARLSEIFHQD